jgi:hypothetical protein
MASPPSHRALAKLDHLIRRLFGSKSERLDPAQLELLFGDMPGKPEASASADALEEVASNAVETSRPAKKRGSQRSRIQVGLSQPGSGTTIALLPAMARLCYGSMGSRSPGPQTANRGSDIWSSNPRARQSTSVACAYGNSIRISTYRLISMVSAC